MPKMQINLDGWQDYRGDHKGAVLYIETSHQSTFPVRDQLGENGKGCFMEPNYETSTYGMMSCCNTRSINSIIKSKARFILFATRYEGFESAFKSKYIIMGYMRVDKIKDMRSRHIQRHLSNPALYPEPECIALEKAMACWSGDMRFVSLEDSFVLSEDSLKSWNMKGRISRQMKLDLESAALDEVLAHINSKNDMTDEYIATVDEFKLAMEESSSEEAAS